MLRELALGACSLVLRIKTGPIDETLVEVIRMSLRRHQPDHRGHSIDEQSQLPFALTQRGLRFPLIVDVFGMTIPANDPATVITRGNGRVAEPAIYAIMPPEPLFTFQRRTGLAAVTPFRVDAFDIAW